MHARLTGAHEQPTGSPPVSNNQAGRVRQNPTKEIGAQSRLARPHSLGDVERARYASRGVRPAPGDATSLRTSMHVGVEGVRSAALPLRADQSTGLPQVGHNQA